MKLIYLYVEKYKNIENQQFVFSHDEDIEVVSKIDNAFKINIQNNCTNKSIYSIGKQNIDIACIVGKNGSGKTAILDCIYHVDWLNNNWEMHEGHVTIKYFAIYKEEEEYCLVSDSNSRYQVNINGLSYDVYAPNPQMGKPGYLLY